MPARSASAISEEVIVDGNVAQEQESGYARYSCEQWVILDRVSNVSYGFIVALKAILLRNHRFGIMHSAVNDKVTAEMHPH